MRISVEQLNGETLVLEVLPDMRMRHVKQQIKDMLGRDSDSTMVLEVILGDKKLQNDETVGETGLSPESKLCALFRQNVAQGCNRRALGQVDPEAGVLVEIPESETEVGANAFCGCKHVAKVTIPSSVSRIGNYAFCRCSFLTSISIPDSVSQIESGAFLGCTSLASVSIPKSITRIGNYTFQSCSSLVSLSMPESVTHVGNYAFHSCSSLRTVTFPESLRHIGNYAFYDCSSLGAVTIPKSVSHIGHYAFQSCCSLARVTIPESVTSLGSAAFKDCTALTQVSISQFIEPHIRDSAFSGCTSLRLIELLERRENGWDKQEFVGHLGQGLGAEECVARKVMRVTLAWPQAKESRILVVFDGFCIGF